MLHLGGVPFNEVILQPLPHQLVVLRAVHGHGLFRQDDFLHGPGFAGDAIARLFGFVFHVNLLFSRFGERRARQVGVNVPSPWSGPVFAAESV